MAIDGLLFYDIEVTSHDALVVFLDSDKHEVQHFWSTRGRQTVEEPSGFEGVAPLITGKTLVGYNNYSYDDNILSLMMNPVTSMPDIIKANNDRIISGRGFGGRKSPLIRSLDTMQQIDASHPSLKQIEGNMGSSIVESSVPFDIGRPLTDAEREEMLLYCRADVAATVDIYMLRRRSYFETKDGLLAMMPEGTSPDAYRWNTTTLSAQVLLGSGRLPLWTEHHVPRKLWRAVPGIPPEVWDMWEDACTPEGVMGKGRSKTIKAFGCNVVFGLGGLHGAPSKPVRCGRVKHADVASMYPSAIVALNALGDATETYDQMRRERVSIKHTDPVRAGALKLILNSVYGNFKNSYSSLFNPLASATVCIYGQIALFSLCRELDRAGYRIINANTDGVVYEDSPMRRGMDEVIISWWEDEFAGFKLETDYFAQWIQKDVNNYIATEENGKVTVKGGDVNKYKENKFFSNNSTRIVQIAMAEKLINGTDILDTLTAHLDDPMLYQIILKAGSTFQGVQDSAGEWQQKVNRVFAAREDVPYTKLYKVRADGAQVNFPDVPERMYLWNRACEELAPTFAEVVDIDWYYQLVREKLKGWP